MKRKYISIILLSTTFLFGSHALAATTGTITIKGKVTEPACKLSIEGGNINFDSHISTNIQYKAYTTASQATGRFTGIPTDAFTKRATLNVTDCYVRNKNVYITFSGLRDTVHIGLPSSVIMPFISDQTDSEMSDVGVYLITGSKTSDGKTAVRDLNMNDDQYHQVFIDLSNGGTGSMTADFELVTMNNNSAKIGDINIPIVASLIVP